jgi:hypothetical protein
MECREKEFEKQFIERVNLKEEELKRREELVRILYTRMVWYHTTPHIPHHTTRVVWTTLPNSGIYIIMKLNSIFLVGYTP